MKKITLSYQQNGDTNYTTIDIKPDDYFDLEPDEIIEVNSSPKYLQPYEYVAIDKSKVSQLFLVIEIDENKLEFHQVFWNNGSNILTERIESGKYSHREIIITTNIENKKLDETIRMIYHDGNFYPAFHAFIKTLDDNRQKLDKVATPQFDFLKQKFNI